MNPHINIILKETYFKRNIGLKDGIDNLIDMKPDTSDKRFKT